MEALETLKVIIQFAPILALLTSVVKIMDDFFKPRILVELETYEEKRRHEGSRFVFALTLILGSFCLLCFVYGPLLKKVPHISVLYGIAAVLLFVQILSLVLIQFKRVHKYFLQQNRGLLCFIINFLFGCVVTVTLGLKGSIIEKLWGCIFESILCVFVMYLCTSRLYSMMMGEQVSNIEWLRKNKKPLYIFYKESNGYYLCGKERKLGDNEVFIRASEEDIKKIRLVDESNSDGGEIFVDN